MYILENKLMFLTWTRKYLYAYFIVQIYAPAISNLDTHCATSSMALYVMVCASDAGDWREP
jgi:hypothetical protein